MTVHDLRSALRVLEGVPGQLPRTETPVDPNAELAGVYRYVGAGGTVQRPTKLGPAMLFENVKGYPGVPVAAGVLASRERTALLLGADVRHLGARLAEAVDAPLFPVEFEGAHPPCQEVIHRPPLDILKVLPAAANTPEDAGAFFTLGIVRAIDPETGEHDIAIHLSQTIHQTIRGLTTMALAFHRAFLALGSNKFEESVAFYSKLLGREPAERIGDYYAAFELPEVRLGIFRPREQNSQDFENPVANQAGLSLVFYVPDLPKAMETVLALGHPAPGPVAENSKGREVYVFDPTGNRIILFEKYAQA